MSDVREDIKAFLDGELPAARAAEVEAALEQDPELRAEADFMKTLSEEIKQAHPRPSTEGLDATLQRLRAVPAWPRRLAWAGGLVGILILIGLIGPIAGGRGGFGSSTQSLGEASAPAAEPLPPRTESIPGSKSVGAPAGPAEAMAGGAANADRSAALPPPEMERLVVKTADITVQVPDAAAARVLTESIVVELGGFVASSNAVRTGGMPSAQLTVRVPVSRFEDAMARIRDLGELRSESSSGQDVTAQVADVEARLRTLRAEEETYRVLLRSARTIGQVLEVRERLTQVRLEIESMDAQRKVLRDQAALSTITVNLFQEPRLGEPEPPKDWWGAAWVSAVNGLSAVGRALAQGLIYVGVFAPIWLPIVGLVWWLNRRRRN